MRFFICGSALRGQPDHGNLLDAVFAGEAHTADASRLRGEPQAQIFVDCAQLDASIRTRLLLKLLCQHITIPGQILRPLAAIMPCDALRTGNPWDRRRAV